MYRRGQNEEYLPSMTRSIHNNPGTEQVMATVTEAYFPGLGEAFSQEATTLGIQ